MQRSINWMAGIGLLVLTLGGCTPTVKGVPLFAPLVPGPKLAANDPIKTYPQYKEAVKAAEAKVPAAVSETLGIGRLVQYTLEISKLPSEQSGKFAEALARTLKWHGVNVPPLERRERRGEMTYDELALMDALTAAAVWGPVL